MATTAYDWRNPTAGATAAPAATSTAAPVSFGQRGGQGAFDYRNKLTYEPGITALNDLLAELSGRQSGFALSLQPQREQSLYDLINALNPANQTAQARSQFGSLLGAGQEAARSNSAALGRAGYGNSARMGAELGARNQAVSAGNKNLLALTSPQAKAQNLAQILQSIGGATQGAQSTLGSYQSLYNTEMGKNQYEDSQSGGGFLSNLLGIGGQLAGMGIFDDLFKSKGSGGSSFTLPSVF